MASNTISDMQKHIDDYRYDIAMVKRRSLEAGPLAKAVERAIYVWDLSARIEFGMTLEELETLVKETE